MSTRDDRETVWQTVKALNFSWTQGYPADLARYFHKDTVAITPADRLRLKGRDACIAARASFRETARIRRWQEFDQSVGVYGDAAVVTYYYEVDCEIEGQHVKLEGRDMFTLVKNGGEWFAVADQFPPGRRNASNLGLASAVESDRRRKPTRRPRVSGRSTSSDSRDRVCPDVLGQAVASAGLQP